MMILSRNVISMLLALMPFALAAQEQADIYLDRKDGLSSNCVNCVMQDSRGFIWIGTDTALDIYDGQGFQSFSTPTLSLAEAGGMIWAGTSRGLYCFNPQNGDYSVFRTVTRYGVNIVRDVPALLLTGDNLLWVGTRGQGLFIYNFSTGELSQQSVQTPFVGRIMEDSSGCVMVESSNGRVDLYNPEGVFLRHTEGSLPPENNSIVDTEGTRWIPSQKHGLGIVTNSQTGTALISFPGKSLQETNIPLSEDSSGNIWLGSGQQLYILPDDRESAAYSPVSFDGVIRDILADDDGIWIGTNGAGIYHYEPHSRHIDHFQIAGDIDILYRLRNGTLMVGFEKGLYLYNASKQSFEPDLNRKDITIILDGEKSSNKNLVEFEVVSKGHVSAITEDLSGHLYMSTSDHGLFRKNLVTGGWEHLVSSKGGNDVIPGNKITTMHTVKDGSVWAGTDGSGIWRLEEGSLVFSRISLPNTHLEGATITSLTSDPGGRIWIGSTLGILCYDPQNESTVSYDVNSGYLLYSKRGELLIGQKDALVSLVPERNLSPIVNPPVVIRSMEAGEKMLYIPPGGRQIELPYNSNSFSIRMACLSYVNPSAKRYSWKLEGYDNDWTRMSTLNTASYTKIPPGKYRFVVEGSNDTLSIIIRPPWWRTKAAWTVWILLAITAIGTVVYFNQRRIRRRYDRIIKEQNEQREKEWYKRRIRFFIGLVHEIRTPLTLIRLQHEKEAPKADDTISRNLDYMQGTIDRILTYDKNTSDGVDMLLTRVDLATLSRDVLSSFHQGAKARNITVELSAPENPVYVSADEDLLHKILNNLLSNALKYAHNRILIKVWPKEEEAVLSVEDDGPGVRKKERDRIFEMFYTDPEDTVAQASGMGVGLAYSMQLAKAHGGTITVGDSSLGGAAFALLLPLMKEVASKAPVSESENTSSGFTVLIVEDNLELLETLHGDLSPYYKVITSPDGKQAWDKLEKNAVDVVVSDVMMPVMNGLELCRKIKADVSYSHIPVILLTAKVTLPDKTEGMESGADAYVEKPFSIRQLKGQIDNLIRLREAFRKVVSEGRSLPENSIHSPEADFMKSIDTAIEKHIDDESFSIEALASDMAMSRTNFFRKFKALTGGTPNDYLKNYRMNRAAQLMRNGARINEAAFQVGFSSSSYFAKCFKARFGVLPKDYLKR